MTTQIMTTTTMTHMKRQTLTKGTIMHPALWTRISGWIRKTQSSGWMPLLQACPRKTLKTRLFTQITLRRPKRSW